MSLIQFLLFQTEVHSALGNFYFMLRFNFFTCFGRIMLENETRKTTERKRTFEVTPAKPNMKG